ncbi:hypothetical protein H8N03_11670 [Ramlibacter sp. USB13]|uniref:DUF4034 domain-containing protein n=1 Tax=Ramlibacter cellulosilyticus TaxID=2764187 RepID=A0A923MQH0_9BURK|nr:hypothetical protein [Ramlibacter cellulosilyticus]MBC5783605.1 hypothetical protein [Ramlibacter cellulosilyticus]
MGVIRWGAAALAAAFALHAHAAGEDAGMREQIRDEVQRLFAAGDYRKLEASYNDVLAKRARTYSGEYMADVMRKAVAEVPGAPAGDHGIWERKERALQDWLRQYPRSTLAAVGLSRTYLSHGWAWRGGGYSRDVSDQGRQKMAEYTQRAYDTLMAQQDAGRSDPYWYAQMLMVSRMQGWPRERFVQLAGEATQAFPLNQDIYLAAANRLLPQWGGSMEAFEGFADYAVQRSRASEGESMFARIYVGMAEQMHLDLSAPGSPWPRIRAGFEDLVKRYPDSSNLNQYAWWACQARDMETARKVLARIGDQVEPDVWPSRANYVRCMQAAGVQRATP